MDIIIFLRIAFFVCLSFCVTHRGDASSIFRADYKRGSKSVRSELMNTPGRGILQLRANKLRLQENLYLRKAGHEKGRRLREALSSLRLGESIVPRDVRLMRKNTRVRIYATHRPQRRGIAHHPRISIGVRLHRGPVPQAFDSRDRVPRSQICRVQHGDMLFSILYISANPI